MLPKWGGRLSSEGQRGESRMGRGQEQADLVKLKMAFRPQLIRPLSSHVLRCSCDLSSVCFHTSFVKIIRLMNENISNVELGEMLNSHPWAPGSSRDRSPGGEERDGGNPRVRSGLSQTLQLARAGDDYVCLPPEIPRFLDDGPHPCTSDAWQNLTLGACLSRFIPWITHSKSMWQTFSNNMSGKAEGHLQWSLHLGRRLRLLVKILDFQSLSS